MPTPSPPCGRRPPRIPTDLTAPVDRPRYQPTGPVDTLSTGPSQIPRKSLPRVQPRPLRLPAQHAGRLRVARPLPVARRLRVACPLPVAFRLLVACGLHLLCCVYFPRLLGRRRRARLCDDQHALLRARQVPVVVGGVARWLRGCIHGGHPPRQQRVRRQSCDGRVRPPRQ